MVSNRWTPGWVSHVEGLQGRDVRRADTEAADGHTGPVDADLGRRTRDAVHPRGANEITWTRRERRRDLGLGDHQGHLLLESGPASIPVGVDAVMLRRADQGAQSFFPRPADSGDHPV